jgi:hypothetical protein
MISIGTVLADRPDATMAQDLPRQSGHHENFALPTSQIGLRDSIS